MLRKILYFLIFITVLVSGLIALKQGQQIWPASAAVICLLMIAMYLIRCRCCSKVRCACKHSRHCKIQTCQYSSKSTKGKASAKRKKRQSNRFKKLKRKKNSKKIRGFSSDSEKAKFQRNKPSFCIGTIGCRGVGKTTLTAAITRILAKKGLASKLSVDEIDNYPEEKASSCSIKSKAIEYETDHRHYTHTDCPGSVDYIKNMITGVSQIQAAILVVTDDLAVTPQTQQHLLLAKVMGVSNIVVYLNDTGAVDDEEMMEIVHEEIKSLLECLDFSGSKIIKGSALKAYSDEGDTAAEQSVIELLAAIDSIPTPDYDLKKPFVMSVEEVFDKNKKGVLVTGCVESGVISVNDTVDIVGLNDPFQCTIESIEIFHKKIDSAQAGDSVGILLQGNKHYHASLLKPKKLSDVIQRGQLVCQPGACKTHTRLKVKLNLFSKKEKGRHTPFFTGHTPQFYFRTADVPGRISLPDQLERVMPGDAVKGIVVDLMKPVAVEKGQCFVICDGTGVIGHGAVSQLLD
jgi:elongation factor Tu